MHCADKHDPEVTNIKHTKLKKLLSRRFIDYLHAQSIYACITSIHFDITMKSS